MEITKEFLQARVVGMRRQLSGLQQQAVSLTGQIAMVQGAIDDCETLLRYLEAPDPKEKATRMAEEVAKALEDARIRELQHQIYDCPDNGQEELAQG